MLLSSSCIGKDSEVEVTPEDERFQGSWYRAILEENPKKSRRQKLLVRYKTLLDDEDGSGSGSGSTHLTENVDRRNIRPVPSEELYHGVVLEEGSVVDAYLKDGWWIGVVIKKLEKKFLVHFDSPPDIMEFERNQLRAHLDWTGSKWIRPEYKELVKSDFSSGALAELRHDLGWVPVIIVKELKNEKKFIVIYSNKSFDCRGKSRIVDSIRVRPTQPCFDVGGYELLDRVEVFCGCIWRQGVVRGILYEGRYMISFGATKEASQFDHSDLRPIMEWEDGVWYKTPEPKLEEGSLDGKRNKSVVSETRNVFVDGSGNEKELNGKRKRRELEHIVLSLDHTPNVVKNSTLNVEEIQAKDALMVLPFAKKSPIWKTYETMEVFKRVPQSPHFSPLVKSKEDFREGFALGMMVTFSGLLEKLKDLEADVTISQLDSLKDSFTELEKHGFDVRKPLSRIEKLLALKDRQLIIMEKQEGLDKEKAAAESIEKCKAAKEEINEIECEILEVKNKILELQRQEVALEKRKKVANEQKDASYRKICEMESYARELSVELEDVEYKFETTLAAPW